MKYFLFLLFLIPLMVLGNPKPEEAEINIDLMSFCQDEDQKPIETSALNTNNNQSCVKTVIDPPLTKTNLNLIDGPLAKTIAGDNQSTPEELKNQKLETCKMVRAASEAGTEPIFVKLKDDQDNTWKVKFYFGYNRTKYFDTDLHVQTTRANVTIKDFSFAERTSGEYYNPKNWPKITEAFRWIDEPTNSFVLALEHKNSVFEITMFHPKFLKQQFEQKIVTGTVDGTQVNGVQEINTNPLNPDYQKPGQLHMVRFESTHKQLDLQVGFGHKFNLVSGKGGTLSVTPHGDVGVTVGENRLIYEKKDQPWIYEQQNDTKLFQGMNVTAGAKLEYQYGKVSIFVDPRFTHSHLTNKYADGSKIDYKMNYIPVAIGMGIELPSLKKKSQKKPTAIESN